MRKFKRIAGVVLAAVLAVAMPATAMADMRGIDVSGHNARNVTEVADYDFAVVKVTQGTNFVNGYWGDQVRGVLNRNKSLGLYHFANGGDANAEADYFLSLAAPYVGRAVLVLDWEQCLAYRNGRCSSVNRNWGNGDWVRTWVNRVHQRTGVWPVIYVQASAVRQIPSDVRGNCGIWVAQYPNNRATGYQSHPWNLGKYGEAMRQYTSNGYVAGYSGRLDLNVFRGERWQWEKYANPSSDVKPPSVTSVPAKPQSKTQTQPSSLSVRVRRGDTISNLAYRYNRYPLSAWNVPSGNINRIYPGQIVTYRGGATQTAATPTKRTHRYTVRRGDTLSRIAQRNGVSVSAIHGYRSGNPNRIYPGEVLYW